MYIYINIYNTCITFHNAIKKAKRKGRKPHVSKNAWDDKQLLKLLFVKFLFEREKKTERNNRLHSGDFFSFSCASARPSILLLGKNLLCERTCSARVPFPVSINFFPRSFGRSFIHSFICVKACFFIGQFLLLLL